MNDYSETIDYVTSENAIRPKIEFCQIEPAEFYSPIRILADCQGFIEQSTLGIKESSAIRDVRSFFFYYLRDTGHLLCNLRLRQA